MEKCWNADGWQQDHLVQKERSGKNRLLIPVLEPPPVHGRGKKAPLEGGGDEGEATSLFFLELEVERVRGFEYERPRD